MRLTGHIWQVLLREPRLGPWARGLGFSSGLCCLALLFCCAGASATIYDYTAVPEPGETFGTTLFRMYVPDGVQQIRGVFFNVAPHLSDSRPLTADPTWQALCKSVEFGLMGALLDDMYMDTGVGAAVLRALAAFAEDSAHPEISHAALYFEGYSWGGQFSYHFTRWLPERVIGFVTMKGGFHTTEVAGEAILVPGYLFIGEYDLPYRIENLTDIFEVHRPLGARWILAVQPGAGHEPITDRNLLDQYFHTVSSLRLPEIIPPEEPPVLLNIPEPSGWLGNRLTHLIGSWACYDAVVDSACWFPSRDVGNTWQAFVSAGAVTDTIPCPTAVQPVDELPGAARLLQNFPNPFNPRTTIACQLTQSQQVELTVFDASGRLLTSLVSAVLQAGYHEWTWEACDKQDRPLPSGVYFYRLVAGKQVQTRRMVLVR